MRSSTTSRESNGKSSINGYNIANSLAYLANTIVTFGIGQFGWGGRPSNGELSEKYQTLVTPSGGTFSIWGPIFILQFIWCLWQFVPNQRNSPGVLAVSYNYVGVCLMQIGWTLSFSYEIIWLSLLCMYGILFFLLRMHLPLQSYDKIWKGYFLWQFPFSLHLGWIIAASLVNTNVVAVRYGAAAQMQYILAIISLSLVVIAAIAFLVQYPVDLTPPLVLVWAVWGISSELDEPKQLIIDTFTTNQINTMQMLAFSVLSAVGVLTLLKIVYVVLVQQKRRRDSNDKDNKGDTYNNLNI